MNNMLNIQNVGLDVVNLKGGKYLYVY